MMDKKRGNETLLHTRTMSSKKIRHVVKGGGSRAEKIMSEESEKWEYVC